MATGCSTESPSANTGFGSDTLRVCANDDTQRRNFTTLGSLIRRCSDGSISEADILLEPMRRDSRPAICVAAKLPAPEPRRDGVRLHPPRSAPRLLLSNVSERTPIEHARRN